MSKIVEPKKLLQIFKDGMTFMIGGFLNCGVPEKLIDMLVDLKIMNLTIISNDSTFEDKGVGKLISNGQIKKLIASHIGTNPQTGRLMAEEKLEVELVPQGTLAERIRAGGAGLGGILTPTGVGTLVEKDKNVIHVDGKDFLLELPLKADIALIKGSIVDEIGNIYYKGTSRNFNPLMALAAETVIVEAKEIVNKGGLEPEMIMTPGAVVDYIVRGG